MTRSKKLLLLVPALLLTLTACGASNDGSSYSGSTPDPLYKGWIPLQDPPDGDNIYKKCDGTTLLYAQGNNIHPVPNSSECTAVSP